MVASVTPPVPDVTGAVGTKVAGWCAALCRASQCLAWLLGDGAGSQSKGGRVPCPVPPHREKLPGSSWHRSRKKGESIWEDRKEEIKKQNKKTHPVWIQEVALHTVPAGENIPEGIFHYCSATLVSLLKTFWMCISNSCRKSSPCVSCNVGICIPSVTDGNCCLAFQMIWRGFNT